MEEGLKDVEKSVIVSEDELVVDQLGHGQAVLRVLDETLEDEVLGLAAYWHALREVNFLIDYFHQIFFRSYLKRHPSVQQLIGQYPNIPHIYLVVILLLLDDLRRGVERCPAAGIPHQRRMDRPSEVTYFGYALTYLSLLPNEAGYFKA